MTCDLVVIGIGYVGMPLAQAAVAHGMTVVGLDTSTDVVEGLNSGHSHIDDISDAEVEAMLAAGFSATTEPAVIAGAEIVVICVPTPLSTGGGPDLAAVTGAAESVSAHLVRGQLVILESTSFPGTTEDHFAPILERSGLKTGDDYSLAFSPERVDPGNSKFGFANTPKVVAGVDGESLSRAVDFYGKIANEVVPASGIREAETSKLLENTYRQVNIALANEIARACHDLNIDVWEVIRLASTKPFGFQPFFPGPGVGGHCIPIDPMYLSYHINQKTGQPLHLVELAQAINNDAPEYVAQRVVELLEARGEPIEGSSVLLLGVTYKANIADQRESPSKPLAQALADRGMLVQFHDPHVPHWNLPSGTIDCVADLSDAIAHASVTVLVRAHDEYDLEQLCEDSAAFLDTSGRCTHPSAVRL